MKRYTLQTTDDHINALREILQELALLGLWRGKFFEHAAFYGGTALRVLHGLDRYSEDLDFSLLKPNAQFSLKPYAQSLQREIASFGFTIRFEERKTPRRGTIESAFLKGNTLQQLVVIGGDQRTGVGIPANQLLKIKLEVDTDPPGGFTTESRYILAPLPFAVRTYTLPDLFAGKLHAVLCRKWRKRVKGRDWYDLVWYLGRHPELNLRHLQARMRQSGDHPADVELTPVLLMDYLQKAINSLDVEQAKTEVTPFLTDPETTRVWSKDFFHSIIDNIVVVEA